MPGNKFDNKQTTGNRFAVLAEIERKKLDERRKQLEQKERDERESEINKLNQEIKNNPIANNYYQRGLAYYLLGKFDEAIKDFTEALKLKLDPTKRAETLQYRGRSYGSLRKYRLAAGDYTAAARINFSNDSYIMYFRSGNKNDTTNVQPVNCNDDRGMGNYLPVVYIGDDSYEKALARFDIVFKPCDPTNPNYHYELGVLHYDAGKYQEALKAFSTAIEKADDKFVSAYYVARRDTYLKLNENGLAAKDLEKIKKHCPDYQSEDKDLNLVQAKDNQLLKVGIDITGESYKVDKNDKLNNKVTTEIDRCREDFYKLPSDTRKKIKEQNEKFVKSVRDLLNGRNDRNDRVTYPFTQFGTFQPNSLGNLNSSNITLRIGK